MKKGFTLIELLAVIVILAIIALIATPIVLSIINDTKESAVLRNAEFYLDGVEQSVMKKSLAMGSSYKPNTCIVQFDGNLLCDNKDTLKVEVSGEVPDKGKIVFSNGKITSVSLSYSNNNKVVTKEENEEIKIVTANDGYQNYLVESKYGVKIGDYVNYTFDTAGEYTIEAVYSGYDSDQPRAQVANSGMKWRVLGIDDNGNLELVSETSVRSLYFKNAAGYNNAVFILNDLSKAHYSNAELGAVARNLSIEDIEKHYTLKTMEARNTFMNRAKSSRTYGAGNNYYPIIYKEELKSGVEGVVREGGISSSDAYFTSKEELTALTATATNNLLGTRTYYTFSNIESSALDNKTFYDMIFGIGTNYWLSSRFICLYEENMGYGLFRIRKNTLDGAPVYLSDNTYSHDSRAIRPVVTLPEDIILVDAGDGTYNIEEEKVCKLVEGEANTVGSKYQCKVKDAMETGFEDGYYFYVLSHNDDGATNLIMDRNMCSDGTVQTENQECYVDYSSSVPASAEGPTAAMTYLSNATKEWKNIPNLNFTYDDEGGNFTNFIITAKARMPRYDEINGTEKCLTVEDNNSAGSCPLWLVNYMKESSYYSTSKGKIEISNVYSYWTLSSRPDFEYQAVAVGNNGFLGYTDVYDIEGAGNSPSLTGVRPVITLEI